jgi:hypothetical protein
MVTEQHVLDHLAFVMRKRMKYIHAEHDPSSEWF